MPEQTLSKSLRLSASFALVGYLACACLAQGQQQVTLGLALYQHGLTQGIARGDDWATVYGRFNPNSAMFGSGPLVGARFEWPTHTKGPMIGPEGIGKDQIQSVLDAHQCGEMEALGLPAGYRATDLDAVDANYVASGRGSSVRADWLSPCIARLGSAPVEAGCVLPKVCMTPPVPVTCAPTCDSPLVCVPKPEACAAAPLLTSIPGPVLETLRLAQAWVPANRPQQRRRLADAYRYLLSVEAVKVVTP